MGKYIPLERNALGPEDGIRTIDEAEIKQKGKKDDEKTPELKEDTGPAQLDDDDLIRNMISDDRDSPTGVFISKLFSPLSLFQLVRSKSFAKRIGKAGFDRRSHRVCWKTTALQQLVKVMKILRETNRDRQNWRRRFHLLLMWRAAMRYKRRWRRLRKKLMLTGQSRAGLH